MIHTPSGRSLLSAALCICCAQTFIDGSAQAMRFLPAFAVALDAYVGSSTEAAVAAEIRKITDSAYPPPPASPLLPEHTNTSTWFPLPAWLKKRKDKKRQERKEKEEEREEEEGREALVEIIKTHRLRFHEERKAQKESANPL
ncbi:hypothetical protein K438DRAFT_1805291 [Mycena galopus ATCC 62051]|nr:hypothetical protein K438DRAFT_1805291 [Mycena galopus ATCC 62051]